MKSEQSFRPKGPYIHLDVDRLKTVGISVYSNEDGVFIEFDDESFVSIPDSLPSSLKSIGMKPPQIDETINFAINLMLWDRLRSAC